MNHPIRIVIADDHAVVRKALVQFLESKEDMTVIGEAPDGMCAIEIVEDKHPDVVLMDYNMPNLNGVEATRHILTDHPEVCIIGLSMHETGSVEGEMLAAGAAAYLPKNAIPLALESTIRQCACQDRHGPPDGSS